MDALLVEWTVERRVSYLAACLAPKTDVKLAEPMGAKTAEYLAGRLDTLMAGSSVAWMEV